jgi:hypothetical protein
VLVASIGRRGGLEGKGRGENASRAGIRDRCIIDWISGNRISCTATLETPQTVGDTEFSAELGWSSSAPDIIWRQQGKKGGHSRRASKSEKLLDTCDAGWRTGAVVSVGLERGRDDEVVGPQGERGCKGVTEEVEAGGLSKGGKRYEERAEVEPDGAVKRWETK